jgi:hypothetical protein
VTKSSKTFAVIVVLAAICSSARFRGRRLYWPHWPLCARAMGNQTAIVPDLKLIHTMKEP